MQLADDQPMSQRVQDNRNILLPKFPVVEAHGHISLWTDNPPSPEHLIECMEQVGMTKFVDLDAGVIGPTDLYDRIDHFRGKYPDRFVHAAGIDWNSCLADGGTMGTRAAEQLGRQHSRGASVLKIWKNVGTELRDRNNRLVFVDDDRLTDLWDLAAELRMPVFLHIGDPLAFFQAPDETNERYEELRAHPDWCFFGEEYPSMEFLLSGLERLVSAYPNTIFIGAHVGCIAEDLRRVGALLDRCSNYYIDLSARLNELGRQPYSSRTFLTKYADRILFGTDTSANPGVAHIWYRFLETRDENFPYSPSQPPDQGRWNIYGVELDDEVLRKIYSENAERLLFS